MMRILQNDFKKVVEISWYMWIFMVFYLLLNVNGWHTYFWIAFIPLLLLLAIGTKLQHIIAQLAQNVVEKHMQSASVVQGDLVLSPSDDLFWFGRPRLIMSLIHFILFQNAFQIAFFFWILITYGFNSCIMGKAGFTVPRLVIGVVIQFVCSYSTLPLYAIVSQMGSCMQMEIFEEITPRMLQEWKRRARRRKERFQYVDGASSEPTNTSGDSAGPSSVEMTTTRAAAPDDTIESIE